MTRPRSHLAWLCRRGTRELDLLLRGYLDRAYDNATRTEQEAFVSLLEKQDPELQALFFGSVRNANCQLESLVDHIVAAAAPDA
ncbi:MAG: succinate dehydrogenase assembly factor 2 [Methylotetracoccus sp.]|nr:succinate dehydrogenase assembly factor 2 [Methylotetracoccus sp.]